MSSYDVYLSDSSLLASVLDFREALEIDPNDSGYDSTVCSISLLRTGKRFYANALAESLVHIMESFAGAAEPDLPLVGQLWYDSANKQLKVRDVDANWQAVGSDEAAKLKTPVTISVAGDVVNQGTSFDGSIDITLPIELKPIIPAGSNQFTPNVSFAAPTITVDEKGRVIAIADGPTIPSTGGLAQDALVVHKAGDTMTGSLVLSGPGVNLNVVNGKVKEAGNDLMPSGAIIMWSGTVLPGGWKLCDGSNGTPDLRNRFINGGDLGSVGQTGGSTFVTVNTASAGDHNHTVSINAAGGHNHGGTTGSTVLTTAQIPAHKHALSTGVPIKGVGYGYSGSNGVTPGVLNDTNDAGGGGGHDHSISAVADHTHTGSATSAGAHVHSVSHDNRPQFYVLAFIMKT